MVYFWNLCELFMHTSFEETLLLRMLNDYVSIRWLQFFFIPRPFRSSTATRRRSQVFASCGEHFGSYIVTITIFSTKVHILNFNIPSSPPQLHLHPRLPVAFNPLGPCIRMCSATRHRALVKRAYIPLFRIVVIQSSLTTSSFSPAKQRVLGNVPRRTFEGNSERERERKNFSRQSVIIDGRFGRIVAGFNELFSVFHWDTNPIGGWL